MPLMKSLAPVRLASRAGHTVLVTAEGSFVPEVLVPEALSRGCVLTTVEPSADLGEADATPPTKPVEPDPPVAEPRNQRLTQIREAVALLVATNDPADFTATGVPRVAAVRRVVDDSVTAEEISEAMLLVRGG